MDEYSFTLRKLPPFKLERYFARHEFTTRYLLSSSDCESLTVGELLALEPDSAGAFMNQWLGYTESAGAPGLRRQISRIYQSIDPEDVLVHSGAEEAILLAMHAVLQPGDHVIVHWPCYQSLFDVARSIGCEVSRWEARFENGWALDLTELQRILKPHTRMIIVNTPHNPTGYLMPMEEYRALVNFAEANRLLLFSDEVYRESEYDPATRLPPACDLSANAISLGVMSKTYGLPGLRIGWIATHNREIYRRMAELKDYTTICNSASSEFLAELALRHREQLVNRSLDIIRANLHRLDQFFARNMQHFTWVRPHAGPIAFPRLVDGNVDDFCEALVTQKGVLLLPGSLFDFPGGFFRIGFGRRNLPEALDRLESAM